MKTKILIGLIVLAPLFILSSAMAWLVGYLTGSLILNFLTGVLGGGISVKVAIRVSEEYEPGMLKFGWCTFFHGKYWVRTERELWPRANRWIHYVKCSKCGTETREPIRLTEHF